MKPKGYEHLPSHPGATVTGEFKKTLHVMNDLIRINIDRISGYEKAAHETSSNEQGIRDTLYRMSTEGRSYVNDLHAEVIRLGGAPVTQSTITGKIYLHWLDGKNVFEGKDTRSLLETCLSAEQAVKKAYRQALDTDTPAIPQPIRELMESQLWALERGCERLETQRSNFDKME